MNGDDELFKKLGITKLSYELIDCKPEEYEPARTSQSTIRILTNDIILKLPKQSQLKAVLHIQHKHL